MKAPGWPGSSRTGLKSFGWTCVSFVLCGWVDPVAAVEFGPAGAFRLRGRFYSQYAIATQDSAPESNGTALDLVDGPPSRRTGQMVQQRNFFEPELDVDLLRLLPEAGSGLGLELLSARLVVRGFYDGIYDYGPRAWHEVLEQYRSHRLQQTSQTTEVLLAGGTVRFPRGLAERAARAVYGQGARVDQAHLDLAIGPLFVRLGRQRISWGEADTIGLLDANNPFDTTLLPGIFLDLEEARIPLWSIRTTVDLFESLGPFVDGFLDVYWVPGWLETSVSPLPIQSASPFAPPPPAAAGYAEPGPETAHVVQWLPDPSLKNSRWGVRLQAGLGFDLTLQAWFYTTFPVNPVPVVYGRDARGQVVTAARHRLTNVIGLATSGYSETFDAVLRAEVELFNGEPGFLAYKSVGQAIESGFTRSGHFERTNILRGEFGADYDLALPDLLPGASITLIGSLVWWWNASETPLRNFRAGGVLKPSAIRREQQGGAPAGIYSGRFCDRPGDPSIPASQRRCDFVDRDPLGAFVQFTIRGDSPRGALSSQLTLIASSEAALTLMPSVVYRLSDAVALSAKYVTIHTFGSLDGGFTPGPGLWRDRDEIWIRATYRLN